MSVSTRGAQAPAINVLLASQVEDGSRRLPLRRTQIALARDWAVGHGNSCVKLRIHLVMMLALRLVAQRS